MADTCMRQYYWTYVHPIPMKGEMSYANAGTVVHKIVEEHYRSRPDIKVLSERFEVLWSEAGLGESRILSNKKNSYWLMILNAIELKKYITSTELKLYWPDAVCYIDAVNSKIPEIYDWKTSTRCDENEVEYRKQMLFYSYMFHRRFQKYPERAVVQYLKYSGSRGELVVYHNEKDMEDIELWYNGVRERIESAEQNDTWEKCDAGQCSFFCPFKEICASNNGGLNMTIRIEGCEIFLEGEIPEMLEWGLDKRFSYELKSSFFIKKNMPGADTKVRFWNKKKRSLHIGFLYDATKIIADYCEHKMIPPRLTFIDMRPTPREIMEMPEALSGKTLRDYQNDSVDAFMRYKSGVLQLPTGAGKTEIFFEILRRLKCRTLFVVNRKELLVQTKKRLKDTLGIEAGVIGYGEHMTSDVTIATIQTLSKNLKALKSYLASVNFVVFDEVHHVPALSYWKLSHYLTSAVYRLGLSATPWRFDGNDMYIEAICGKKCYSLDPQKLIDEGYLMKPTIFFVGGFNFDDVKLLLEAEREVLADSEKKDSEKYMELYPTLISKNYRRNCAIKKIAESHTGKKILILTKYIEHGRLLAEMTGGSHIFGETVCDIRKEVLDDFKNGKTDIIVGSHSIFGEGMDITQLEVVINCAANVTDIASLQSLGRVLRTHKDKNKVYYYDFSDIGKYFRKASNQRRKAFQEQGYDVEEIDAAVVEVAR